MPARNLLVLTTAPVDPGSLREEVRRQLGGQEAQVRLVAPASKMSPLEWLSSDEDAAREEAAGRAQEAAEAVEEVAPTETAVGDPDPVTAIEDALRTFPADEILVVTEPGSEATWLEKDAARDALDRFGLPVRHVVLG